MNRKQTRELAMQMLYQMDIHQDFSLPFFEKNASRELEGNNLDYYQTAIREFLSRKEEIDGLLETAADNWKVDRVNKVEISILRLALTEMLYLQDIPVKVSINEAIDLAKKFSDDQAGKFINGILSRYAGE